MSRAKSLYYFLKKIVVFMAAQNLVLPIGAAPAGVSYPTHNPKETVFYSRWLYGNHTARCVSYLRNSELARSAYHPDGSVKSECSRALYGFSLFILTTGGLIADVVRNLLAVVSIYFAGKRICEYCNKKGPFEEAAAAQTPSAPVVLTQTQTAPAQAATAVIVPNPIEAGKVQELVNTMADHDWPGLLVRAVHLTSLGNEIDHLHPFSFMIAINMDLVALRKMAQLHQTSWKWDRIVGGIIKTSNREHAQGNLLPHVGNFALAMGVQEGQILPYLQGPNLNIKGLVEFLFKR
jgi:hypothetical protein